MTTYSFDKISGGVYTGSGGSPSSGNSGTINTNGTNRKILIACASGRALSGGNSGDYHHVASISASGLTFTRIASKEFHYIDTINGGGFPDAWYAVDLFLADAAAQQTSLAWSATMAAANDTFVNDGWCSVFNFSGANGLDVNPNNFATSSNLTNSSSSISAGPLSTNDNNPLVFLMQLGHTGGVQTAIGLPSGFATTFSGAGGNGQFDNGNNAAATKANLACSFQEFASAQSGANYAGGSSHLDWFSIAFAFGASPPPTVPARSFGIIQT